MKTHAIRPFKTPRSPLVLAAAILLPHLPISTRAESTPQRPEALTVEESAWSRTLIGGGVKTSDSYTDGNFFLTIPLWSTLGKDGALGGSYLFLEPYSSWGEGGEVVTSLGLGFRHLFSDQSVGALKGRDSQAGLLEEGWYVGSSLFVDLLDTETNHQFWQLGVGAEIGSRYFELRGNYYIPMTRAKEIERVRDRQTYVSTSSRSSTVSNTQFVTTGSGYGDPYATGNSIRQDVDLSTTAYTTLATTTRTTTTKTTIETLFRRFEEGMEGWDVEAAVLVPYIDRWFDLQFLGGYFSYDNQPFGAQTGGVDNVHGWKAGVEFRPVPAIALSAMWCEDDRLTGGDWTAGIRFEIPIGKEWKDAFKSRRRHLIERMAEPVARQNAAVKLRDYVTQKQDQQTSQQTSSTTTLQQVTRVVSQTQTQLMLADDVVFVNNGGAVGNGIQAGSSTGDGTAERPVDTIQTGAGIAGGNSNTTGRIWTLYTQRNGPAYAGDVNLSGATRMVSSWNAITTPDGRNFGGNTARPILDGGIGGVGLPFVEINGYDIRGGRSTAVPGAKLVIPDQDPDKHSVLLQDYSLGLRSGIYLEDVSQVIVRNNVLTSQLGRRIVIGANAGKTVVAEVSNNVSMDDQSLAGPELEDYSFGDPRIAARTAYWDTHPTSGITLAGQNANLVANVSGNTLKFNSRGGLEVWLNGGTWSGDIGQNQFFSEYRPILIDASNTAWLGSIVDNSVFRSAATSNLKFDESAVIGNFSGNLLEASTGNQNDDGWEISNTKGSWTGSITNNTLLNSGRGLYFWSDGFQGVVFGNRLTSLAPNSLNTISLITSGTWDGDVYDNILSELRIRLFGENGVPVHWRGDIYQNTVSDELISIRLVGSGTWNGDVRNNTLTGVTGATGIAVTGGADAGTGFTWKGQIAGNTITGSLYPGIDVNLGAFGKGSWIGDISDNRIYGDPDSGTGIEISGAPDSDFIWEGNIARNEIANVDGGILVGVSKAGMIWTGSITGNLISNTGDPNSYPAGDGIALRFDAETPVVWLGGIEGNNVFQNANNGISVYVWGGGLNWTGGIRNNQIRDNGADTLACGVDLEFVANTPVIWSGDISGNTMLRNSSDGIRINVQDGGVNWTGRIAQNTIEANDGNGIYVFAGGDVTATQWNTSITGNTIRSNSFTGLLIYAEGEDPVTHLIVRNRTNWTGDITDNQITGNQNGGASVYFGSGLAPTTWNMSILRNTVNDNATSGMTLHSYEGGTQWIGSIADNQFLRNSFEGLVIDSKSAWGGTGPTNHSGDILRNIASDNGGFGIVIDASGADTAWNGTIDSNRTDSNVNGGLWVKLGTWGDATWQGNVTNNQANGNGQEGIAINAWGQTSFTTTWTGNVTGNQVTGNTSTGLEVITGVYGPTSWNGNISSNTSTGNQESGIFVQAGSNSLTNATRWTGSVSGNDVRNNAFQGIDVQAGVNGLTIWTGNISSNTTINNGHAAPDPANGNGIILWDVGTAGGLLQFNGSFTENLSDQNAGYGIRTIIANPASTFLIGPFNGNLFGTQANGLGNTEHTDTIGEP